MPFDSPDINLGELLKDVAIGKTQLPDFQREWKWDSDQIRSLLASISLGYPVGVLMTLEVGGDSVRFLPRPISGVTLTGNKQPEQLILDGQQRVTSLYQSLYSSNAVDTKDSRGKRFQRWYYLDIEKCLSPDGDREEAVIAVPKDRVVRNFRNEPIADYSTVEQECAAGMFPLSRAFDSPAVDKWMVAYLSLDPTNMPARLARWSEFRGSVLQNLTGYTVPVIVLKKETPKEAVCTVFEKVNTGGVVLNVFELLTATYAAEDFRLNLDWQERREKLRTMSVLRSLESTDFLQAVALLATYERRRLYLAAGNDPATAPGVGCRRKDILDLRVGEYKKWAAPVTEALLGCAEFMAHQYIFQAADLPYRTQLIPLAAIRVALGKDATTYGVSEKLRRWYWCGVMGELYGGTTESRLARDMVDVVAWVHGGAEPQTVADASFNPGRLLTLRTRNSAAYKGVYALLMRGECRDWIEDKSVTFASFFESRLDVHHIFPKHWCALHSIDRARQESIVNKTAISYSTNRIIGGHAPSAYLPVVEKRAGLSPARVDEILRTHEIDPTLLRLDNFQGFFDARSAALLELISAAMGKQLVGTSLEAEGDYEAEDDDMGGSDLLELVEEPA